MKRYLSLILMLALALGAFPAAATGPAEDVNKLAVSELSFENASGDYLVSPESGDIDVSCTVEKINKNDGIPVNFVFFTLVKKDGKIVSRDANEYTVNGASRVYPLNTVTIPSDTEGVTVESFFWDVAAFGKSLAPKATMGTSETAIIAVYADGEKIPYNGGDTLEKEFIASLSHEPEIIAVAKDSAAKVEIEKITRFPQHLDISVTSPEGATDKVTLKATLEEGAVTDAWMYKNDWSKQAIGVSGFKFPDYGTDKDGNPIPAPEGEEYEEVMPVDKTLVFNDRTMYYVDYPAEFRDAYAIQTSMQLFRYASIYSDKANALAKMGNFTINRSANVYLYMAGNSDWAKADGYKSDSASVIKMYYTGQGSKNPISYTGFKRTVIVPEGETADIRIGNYKSSGGGNADYFFVVDFIDPTQFFGVESLSIDGVSGFDFDSGVYEYDVDLAEGINEIPDIYYTLSGIGASAELTGDTAVPGTKTLTVTGATGEVISYKFNFKTFENVLNSIKLDGEEIEGFDKYTLEYTCALPFGWKAEDGFPEITTEQSEFVTASVTQATAENMKAEITVTADMGTPKTYIINYVETLVRPSVEKQIALGWNTGLIKDNTNVYSAAEQLKDGAEVIHGYSNLLINAFNMSTPRAGYTPVMAYMQLDLTKINTDLDLSKPVTFRMHSKFTFYDRLTNNAPWSDGKVTLYDMSGFDWENSNLTTRAIAENLTAVEGKKSIATFSATDVPASDDRSRKGNHDVDITEFVKSCIESGNLTPTIGIYVHKPETVTTVGNRIVYSLYKYNADAMSYIIYNQYE